MAEISSAISQALAQWSELSLRRRLGTVLTMVVGIALFSVILWWTSQDNFVPLLSNLSPEDAAQVLDKLQAERTPYRLAAAGTTILVPESQVYELRLRMAGGGLPRTGGVGFEIFDEPNFGMSRFAEQLNYRRALEGELRRTIRQIDAVREARVHIVMPERGLFQSDEQRASAAVTLQMQPNRHVSAAQVKAITNLVASSVAGLSPERVTLVDQGGAILTRGLEDNDNATLETSMLKQRQTEETLEARVQDILTPVVGLNRAKVRVAATLDFSHSDKTTETFDPEAVVVRSVQVSDEKRGAGAPALVPGGVPGARSNTSGTKAVPPATSATGANDRHNETRNYELSKVVQHDVTQSGRLARLSVAVLVDGVPSAANANILRERTPQELSRLNELVRKAVGFDSERGDQVVVQSMLFEHAAPPPVEVGESPWLAYAERFARPVGGVLIAGMLLLFLLRQRAPLAPHLGQPRTVRELEQAMGPSQHVAAHTASSLPLGRVAALAAGNPAAAPVTFTAGQRVPEPARSAEVLKGWLNEA